MSQHKLTDLLTTLTIFRPSPVSCAVTRVYFPAVQVNLTPTASLENRSAADEECAISFVNDTIVPQVMLAPKTDFNQLVKYESDSDCSDVDSTDYDLQELVNGKPVITHRLEDKSKRGYGLMFRRWQNGKPRN